MAAAPLQQARLEGRIEGSATERYLRALFENALHFPLLNILTELFAEGPARYFVAPDLYAILLGGLVQGAALAFWASASRTRIVLANLCGPAVYTAIEVLVEGMRFFAGPQHWAYWIFSLAIGLLQAAALTRSQPLRAMALAGIAVTRSITVFVMYVVLEVHLLARQPLQEFLASIGHRFVALTMLLLGLIAGVAEVGAARYLDSLRVLSRQLKQYSQWLLGHTLLAESIDDPQRLRLRRERRAVMFMDVRGFTAWSETQSPETVAAFVNDLYQGAEEILHLHHALKYKFTGDEVMALFAHSADALSAAAALRERLQPGLAQLGIAVGMGVHAGQLMEGMLGASETRQYDVIGDTVNTAKRIESLAGKGEIVVSETVMQEASGAFRFGAVEESEAKGKRGQLRVARLLADARQAGA